MQPGVHAGQAGGHVGRLLPRLPDRHHPQPVLLRGQQSVRGHNCQAALLCQHHLMCACLSLGRAQSISTSCAAIFPLIFILPIPKQWLPPLHAFFSLANDDQNFRLPSASRMRIPCKAATNVCCDPMLQHELTSPFFSNWIHKHQAPL